MSADGFTAGVYLVKRDSFGTQRNTVPAELDAPTSGGSGMLALSRGASRQDPGDGGSSKLTVTAYVANLDGISGNLHPSGC